MVEQDYYQPLEGDQNGKFHEQNEWKLSVTEYRKALRESYNRYKKVFDKNKKDMKFKWQLRIRAKKEKLAKKMKSDQAKRIQEAIAIVVVLALLFYALWIKNVFWMLFWIFIALLVTIVMF